MSPPAVQSFIYRCDVCRARIYTSHAINLELTTHKGIAAAQGKPVTCNGGLTCINIQSVKKKA